MNHEGVVPVYYQTAAPAATTETVTTATPVSHINTFGGARRLQELINNNAGGAAGTSGAAGANIGAAGANIGAASANIGAPA